MTVKPIRQYFTPQIWQRIAKPHPSIQDDEQERRARLISGLAVGLFFVLLVGLIAAIGRGAEIHALLSVTILMFPIYLLSRTKYTNLSGILMLIALAYPSFDFFIGLGTSNTDVSVYAGAIWIAMPIVVGGLILQLRDSIIVDVIIVGTLLIIKLFITPDIISSEFWNSFAFLLSLSLVMTFTLKIRETYLVQPQIDKLIRANRVKDEFLATMSHELRTPLNSIIGYTSILLSGIGGEVDEGSTDFLEKIAGSGESLLALITDILDISKIESGEVKISLEDVLVHELQTSWQHRFIPLAQNKCIDFDIQLSPDVPKYIHTDANRITQIVTNLVTNAIKFTEEGHVSLTVKQKHGKLILTVQDTGIGIPDDQINLIFDKFKQVDSSYNRKYEGTGLGLAITQRLVTLFEGSINVQSKPNEGSTFTVTLPV